MEDTAQHQPEIGRALETQRAEELGIDLGLLEENLRLTPLERMRQHDHCVRQILAVQERLGVGSLEV
jgi:hypothetical protein